MAGTSPGAGKVVSSSEALPSKASACDSPICSVWQSNSTVDFSMFSVELFYYDLDLYGSGRVGWWVQYMFGTNVHRLRSRARV